MEKKSTSSMEQRCAVVTGANRGIGFEICKQLASNGITVILTARDEKKGKQSVDFLRNSGLPHVIFHQLDVTDSESIDSLAKFIETYFTELDILLNNAGEDGLVIDAEAYREFKLGGGYVTDDVAHIVKRFIEETWENADKCIRTNYYGTKAVTEALFPLLSLANSPRIVNLSSVYGQLKVISNEKIKETLQDLETLTEDKIHQILQKFLTDFKEDKLKANGWPVTSSAYKVSKVAINAYMRILAKKHPKIITNCVHPGYVRTGMTCDMGILTPEEGARAPVKLALLPGNSPSGLYFDQMNASSF